MWLIIGPIPKHNHSHTSHVPLANSLLGTTQCPNKITSFFVGEHPYADAQQYHSHGKPCSIHVTPWRWHLHCLHKIPIHLNAHSVDEQELVTSYMGFRFAGHGKSPEGHLAPWP